MLDELTRLNRVDPPPAEIATHSALDARMKQFLEIRCRQLEGLTPHRRAANSMIATSKLLQEHRVKVRQRYRNVVETWFAAELDALADASRKKWLIAIATLVDWEMWQSLRTYPARSITESRELLALLLAAALTQMEDEAKGRSKSKHRCPRYCGGLESAPDNLPSTLPQGLRVDQPCADARVLPDRAPRSSASRAFGPGPRM